MENGKRKTAHTKLKTKQKKKQFENKQKTACELALYSIVERCLVYERQERILQWNVTSSDVGGSMRNACKNIKLNSDHNVVLQLKTKTAKELLQLI